MVEEFQEKVRKLSLTISEDLDDPLFFNGWNSVIASKMLSDQYNLDEKFQSIVNKVVGEFKDYDVNRNVRGIVKQMLMYPETDYPPFSESSFSTISIEELDRSFREKAPDGFQLKITQGKLYLFLPNLDWKALGIKIHKEAPHVTVVNSDKMNDDYKKFDGIKVNDIKFTSFKETISKDYPPYKKVIVACLESEILRSINQKKSFHFTIEVEYRKRLDKL